ncbi:hypothetical protein LTR86_010400 [Recurvomyces mirabilis]|nr:hypothetical protein LTR86_010400 [Recurvomyces mirabilis]
MTRIKGSSRKNGNNAIKVTASSYVAVSLRSDVAIASHACEQPRSRRDPTNISQITPTTKSSLGSSTVASQPKQTTIITVPQKAGWPGLILQPDSSVISEDQLTAEIKGIYAGLVIVEAKCINMDNARASDLAMVLDASQWQALIALHRTLLYEHHDFMMAKQHPSATPALRGLPVKYSMPARMWKHGIHAFLEVLRHRRPDSQDYMMSFIYLAYQMTTLLYETVPIFLDTWIECLGDLARYRMAIEEERERHAQWGAVAASWYLKASDRHPQVGRLYHHLAILERPSLRKVAYYGKSLTCVVPFANANDSLRTLYGPLAQQSHPTRPVTALAEASFCKAHAVIFLAKDDQTVKDASIEALFLLQRPKTFSWRECGSPLAVANISPLFMFGAATNPLRLAFDVAIQKRRQRSRAPSEVNTLRFNSILAPIQSNTDKTRRQLSSSKDVLLAAFNTALRCPGGTSALSRDTMAFRDTISFVSVMMCFLHSLIWLFDEISAEPNCSVPLFLGLDEFAWSLVATYLNNLKRLYPIDTKFLHSAQQGVCLEKAGVSKSLPEDRLIRGLVWAFWEFVPGCFAMDEDEVLARSMDAAETTDAAETEARAMRLLYYGLRIAFMSDCQVRCRVRDTPYLTYEADGQGFRTKMKTPSTSQLELDVLDVASSRDTGVTLKASRNSPKSSSGSTSPYVHVRRPAEPSPAATARTYASVARSETKPTEHRPFGDETKIVGEDCFETGLIEA